MYARIGTFDVQTEKLPEVIAFLRNDAVAAFAQHDGFQGYQAYADAVSGRLVGISLWTTREALEGSVETARRALGRAAELGAVLVAEPQILELAFDARPGG